MLEKEKTCTCCDKEYPLTIEYFYQRKDRKSGFSSACKKCTNVRGKKYRDAYRENNGKSIAARKKEYRQKHKKEIAEYSKRYREEHSKECNARNRRYDREHKEERRRYFLSYGKNNRERLAEYAKQYRRNNRQKINKYLRDRRKTDIRYRIAKNLQSRIQRAVRLHGSRKSERTMKLLGCHVEELIKHLESQFLPGMTWQNYGKKWHIDHIRPCVSFNLVDIEEQKKCFNYTNLQPLWAEDNLKKSSWYKGKLIKRGG